MKKALQIVGALAAALAGVVYTAFVWSALWNIVSVTSGAMWIASLAAGAIAAVLALTLLFRPAQWWLFPLCFSGATFLFSIVTMSEVRVALLWLALGSVTFGVALGGNYLARLIPSKPPRS